MNEHTFFRSSAIGVRARRERGIVLIVALIALVLLSLAAIALTRSVDTANVAAGNMAMRQRALAASDLGVEAVLPLFDQNTKPNPGALTTTTSNADSAANCYRATVFTLDTSDMTNGTDIRGVPNVMLDTSKFDTAFSGCKLTVPTTGEVVRYVIDRQCNKIGAPDEGFCNVASVSSTADTDNDKPTGSEPSPLFRVSVRVDGPKNTVVYTQSIIRR